MFFKEHSFGIFSLTIFRVRFENFWATVLMGEFSRSRFLSDSFKKIPKNQFKISAKNKKCFNDNKRHAVNKDVI